MPVQPRAVINDYGTFSDFHSVYGSLTHSLGWHGPSGWAGSSAVGPISWGELVFVWGGTLRGGGGEGGRFLQRLTRFSFWGRTKRREKILGNVEIFLIRRS